MEENLNKMRKCNTGKTIFICLLCVLLAAQGCQGLPSGSDTSPAAGNSQSPDSLTNSQSSEEASENSREHKRSEDEPETVAKAVEKNGLIFADSQLGEALTNRAMYALTVYLTESDIQFIWGGQTLMWMPEDLQKKVMWQGILYFDTDGNINNVWLSGTVPSQQSGKNEIVCSIYLSSGQLPPDSFSLEPDEPTCTIWNTPVNASRIQNLSGSPYSVKFERTAPEHIGVAAQFFIPDGLEDEALAMVNDFVSQSLNPDNTFCLSQLYDKYYSDWHKDEVFTKYIPQVDGYELAYDGRTLSADHDILLLIFETDKTDKNNYFVWRLEKSLQIVETVDITNPESYDLRLYETFDPKADHWGLDGQCPEEYYESLTEGVFAAEDLTPELVKARMLPGIDYNISNGFMPVRVRYEDNVIAAFGGYLEAGDVFNLYQSLPLK